MKLFLMLGLQSVISQLTNLSMKDDAPQFLRFDNSPTYNNLYEAPKAFDFFQEDFLLSKARAQIDIIRDYLETNDRPRYLNKKKHLESLLKTSNSPNNQDLRRGLKNEIQQLKNKIRKAEAHMQDLQNAVDDENFGTLMRLFDDVRSTGYDVINLLSPHWVHPIVSSRPYKPMFENYKKTAEETSTEETPQKKSGVGHSWKPRG